MKVAFLEANCSWLPWLLWRLDEGYDREGDIFMQISDASERIFQTPMLYLDGAR